MVNTITLTREEVREARVNQKDLDDTQCPQFLDYRECECEGWGNEEDPNCRLCKRLTEFAEAG